MINDSNNREPITIRELYPNMTEAELNVAEANLKRYLVRSKYSIRVCFEEVGDSCRVRPMLCWPRVPNL